MIKRLELVELLTREEFNLLDRYGKRFATYLLETLRNRKAVRTHLQDEVVSRYGRVPLMDLDAARTQVVKCGLFNVELSGRTEPGAYYELVNHPEILQILQIPPTDTDPV